MNALLQSGAAHKPAPALAKRRGALAEVVRQYEHDVIERALEHAEGKVSHAARLLGLSYQSLAYMLQHKHKDLMPKRSPIIRRRQSIMRRKHR